MSAEISGILCCPECRKEGWILGNTSNPRELLYKNNYCCTRAILGYFLVLIFTLNEKIPEVKADKEQRFSVSFPFPAGAESAGGTERGICNEECSKSHGAGSGKPYTDIFLLKKVRKKKKKKKEKANP